MKKTLFLLPWPYIFLFITLNSHAFEKINFPGFGGNTESFFPEEKEEILDHDKKIAGYVEGHIENQGQLEEFLQESWRGHHLLYAYAYKGMIHTLKAIYESSVKFSSEDPQKIFLLNEVWMGAARGGQKAVWSFLLENGLGPIPPNLQRLLDENHYPELKNFTDQQIALLSCSSGPNSNEKALTTLISQKYNYFGKVLREMNKKDLQRWGELTRQQQERDNNKPYKPLFRQELMPLDNDDLIFVSNDSIPKGGGYIRIRGEKGYKYVENKDQVLLSTPSELMQVTLGGIQREMSISGVFDGNGGSNTSCKASKYAKNNFVSLFLNNLKLNQNHVTKTETIFAAFEDTFFAIDKNIQDPLVVANQDCSGTTANVVVQVGKKLYIANAGDSTAVFVADDGTVTQLSRNDDLKEAEGHDRKEAMKKGIEIKNKRLPCGLNIRHSLGNKGCGDQIDPSPEITSFVIPPQGGYLVQFSDGVGRHHLGVKEIGYFFHGANEELYTRFDIPFYGGTGKIILDNIFYKDKTLKKIAIMIATAAFHRAPFMYRDDISVIVKRVDRPIF